MDRYGPSTVSFAAPPIAETAYASSSFVSQIYESAAAYAATPTAEEPPAMEEAAVAQERSPEPPVHEVGFLPRIFRPSTRVQSIQRELRIKSHHTVAELLEIRRRFAQRNHPDRADGNSQANATTRMSIANMLIDDAIRLRQSAAS